MRALIRRAVLISLCVSSLACGSSSPTAPSNDSPPVPPGSIVDVFHGSLSAGDPPCPGILTEPCNAYPITFTVTPGSISIDLTWTTADASDFSSVGVYLLEVATDRILTFGSPAGSLREHIDSSISRAGTYEVRVEGGLILSHRTAYTLSVTHSP
jgi:hypothetical protein